MIILAFLPFLFNIYVPFEGLPSVTFSKVKFIYTAH